MKNEFTSLEKDIIYYNNKYREGSPEISDSTYDSLLEKLKKEQPESVLLKRAIIEKAKKSRKTKLPFSMMSLEKEKVFENVLKWARKITLEEDLVDSPLMVITPKLDGISIYQENGLFITRGDGEVGQDCSQHLQHLQKIDCPVSGELIITNRAWKSNDIFRNYKHPRNVVSGWVNGDYDESVPYHYMSLMTYKMFSTDKTKIEQLEFLNNNYNTISMPYVIVPLQLLSHETLESVFRAWKTELPIDGIVIEFNDLKYRKRTLPNGNPEYMIAYKHSSFSEIGETKINEIEFAINRYGVMTPTIIFEKIDISGAKPSRVNGINMSYIYDWRLLPGEIIEIVRSGEVIPKIISVGGVEIPFSDNFSDQKEFKKKYEENCLKRQSRVNDAKLQNYIDSWCVCPFCDTPLKWDETLTNEVCTNEGCPERRFQQIVDFFKIFEVENIAEGTLRVLYGKGFNTVKKVLDITEEELLQIDGFAEKSSKDFVSTMNNLKINGGPLARHMHASGLFPNLGEKTLQLIIDSREDGDVFSKAELIKVNGIGEKTAEVFLNGLPYFLNRERLGVHVTYVETPKKEKKEGIFSGNVFCFTGCRPTEEMRKQLEDAGAEIVENFTSKVTHLVTKDVNSTSSKVERAKKSGVIIVTLEDLIKKQ